MSSRCPECGRDAMVMLEAAKMAEHRRKQVRELEEALAKQTVVTGFYLEGLNRATDERDKLREALEKAKVDIKEFLGHAGTYPLWRALTDEIDAALGEKEKPAEG